MELTIDKAAEQTILSALREGDVRRAARLMVRSHGLAVFERCFAIVGDTSTAEDLTQASFARAFALLAGFRGDLNSREWLLGIAERCTEEHGPRAARAAESPPERPGIRESLIRRLEVLAAAL
jgi:DNA-directed RNA polymerase specialized sigma24 family protein